MLQSAFARYYAERAEMVGMDLKELFRVGRRSLAIGGSPPPSPAASSSRRWPGCMWRGWRPKA